MSQGVQQGQTHSRRQVTNALELPLLQQWEGGLGEGGLGGSPGKATPNSPVGHLHSAVKQGNLLSLS